MSKLSRVLSIASCFIFISVFIFSVSAFAQTCIDGDGDGYGLNGDASCPNPGVDCDDTRSTVHPGAPLICDALDNNCDGFKDFLTDEDKDGDGEPWCGGDCDDNNPNRSHLILEGPYGDARCSDGIDNDCDSRIDDRDSQCKNICTDVDGDGYGNPGHSSCPNGSATDCNDSNAAINPGASDANCNGIDEDCIGGPDSGYVTSPTNCGEGECASTGTLSCSAGVETDTCVPAPPVDECMIPGDPANNDGIDNDCDGLIDECPIGPCWDVDGDGYGYSGDPSCPNGTAIDCDDNNAAINPGASDANCDGVDDNCSGTADEGYIAPVTNCGVGECINTGLLECQNQVPLDTCTPLTPIPEICDDGLDNDCDGLTDQISGIADPDCDNSFIDNDGDGYCADSANCTDGSIPGDCDDTRNTVYPGAPLKCDGLDNNCDGYRDFLTDEDKDGDGVPWCGGDCNDNDSNRFPGNTEGPFGNPNCSDGIDNDCDGHVDEQVCGGCASCCLDEDGDGYGVNGDPSCTLPGADCDDSNPLINPGGDDTNCNGIDEDCSGVPDDGFVSTPIFCGVGECATSGWHKCEMGIEVDACIPGTPGIEGPMSDPTCSDTLDNDCDGLTDGADNNCLSDCLDNDGDGYGANGDPTCTNPGIDCDDSDPNVYPGGDDANCNGIDEDCDGTPDDGYVPPQTFCGIGGCYVSDICQCINGVEECPDCTPLPPAPEGPPGDPSCDDAIDNDCDGVTDLADQGCQVSCADTDVDGYGSPGDPSCPNGSANDCDDTDPQVFPGAPIICDGKDNNCDTYKDFLTDEDKDGDGVPWCGGDCNDNDPNKFPGNQEGPKGDATCSDGIDNDCDTKIDDLDTQCQDSCNDADGDGYGCPGDPSCSGGATPDCDCVNPTINPGMIDANCDGVDDNCDGTADEGYVVTPTNCGTGVCAAGGQLECQSGVEIDTCVAGTPQQSNEVIGSTCNDTLDNDCDGPADAADGDCFDDCIDNDGDGYGSNGHINCTAGTSIDCNDNDAAVNPGATDDTCDGIDDNCSGTPDDEYVVTPTNCGVGECVNSGQMECQNQVPLDTCVPLPSGAEGPFGQPTCFDGLDNDCDGDTDGADLDCADVCNDDGDGDGYCTGPVCNPSCGTIPGDCDDNDPLVFPGASIICDGKDNNCDGYKDFLTDEDKDGDGVPWCDGDCNDNNPNMFPGNTEGPLGDPTCSDGIDNDCDGVGDNCPPDPCLDHDGDGYGAHGDPSCPNPGLDCNNSDASVYPGAPDDNCDGIDNNCNGTADDGYVPTPTNCGAGECANTGQLECQSSVLFDTCVPGTPVVEAPLGSPECSDGLDNDCDGVADGSDPGCLTACLDIDGDGYGSNGDPSCPSGTTLDCDDSNSLINPGLPDVNCNGIDENCSGTADNGYVVTPTNCGIGSCSSSGQLECQSGVEVDTCVPGSPVPENTPNTGVCLDGLDNDCDGLIDQVLGIEDPDCSSLDSDDDGDGLTENQGDCDDTDPLVFPGAQIICDGKDNNCDGYKDFLTDEDKDGDGVPWCDNDCNDNDPNRFPGNWENAFCNPTSCTDGIDNDCDSRIDASDSSCNADGCIDCDRDGYPLSVIPKWCPAGPPLDCDDSDPNINPGVTEGPLGDATCSDIKDNDCDALTDIADPGCSPCIDNDGDGYGSNDDPSCPNPGVDCNDSDTAINPGATDNNCDNVDDNCSGTADDGYVITPTNCGLGECASTGQLECQNGVEVNTCVPLAAGTEGPFGDPTCFDTLDNDCNGLIDECVACPDDDGDGFPECDGSCDPLGQLCDCMLDPDIYPGAPPICDGKDSNCDGFVDFPTDVDQDGDGVPLCAGDCDDVNPIACCDNDLDGYGNAGGYFCANGSLDCNDNNPAVNPGAIEGPFGDPTCSDTLDNDCDGLVDTDGSCTSGNILENGSFENGTQQWTVTAFQNISTSPPHLPTDGSFMMSVTDVYGDLIQTFIAPDTTLNLTFDRILQNPVFLSTPLDAMMFRVSVTNSSGGLVDSIGMSGPPAADTWQTVSWSITNLTVGEVYDLKIYVEPNFTICVPEPCTNETGTGTVLIDNVTLNWDQDGDGQTQNQGDCDDTDATVHTGALKLCDGIDNDCDTIIIAQEQDTDNDGYVYCTIDAGGWDGPIPKLGGDCDDNDIDSNPGLTEGPYGDPTCSDNKDNDCDGHPDAGESNCINPPDIDNDGDGYCEGPTCSDGSTAGDCNDIVATFHPGGWDYFCNDKDENCDGTPDDGYVVTDTSCGVGECASTGQLTCSGGVESDSCTASAPGTEGPIGDPTCADGLDNDCDGLNDNQDSDCNPFEEDNDGDGFCEGPTCNDGSTPGDCDDSNLTVNPNAVEDCFDGIDNDCDNFIDVLDDNAVYTCTDSDLDGYSIEGSCCGPVDCDDADPEANPGAAEVCSNTKDDDCNGLVDDPGIWGTELIIEPSGLSIYYDVDVGVDENNNAMAVWSMGVFPDYQIWANRYTAGSGWETPVKVETGTGEASDPVISIDGNGNAIAAWIKGTGKDIWASRYTAGSGWGIPELIEQSASEAEALKIAIDESGNAIVVWYQLDASEYNIWTNTYTSGTGWGSPQMMDQVNNALSVRPPDIAMSSDGKAIIIWVETLNTNGPTNDTKVMTRHYTPGSGWSTAERINNSTPARGMSDPSIAMNDSGDAVASWTRTDPYNGWMSNTLVVVNHYTAGSGWGTDEFVETYNSGDSLNPQVAVSSNGNAVVVWKKDNGLGVGNFDLWANEFTAGSGWDTPQLLEQSTDSAYVISDVAMDSVGNAVVLWQQGYYTPYSLFANSFTPGFSWGAPKLVQAKTAGNIVQSSMALNSRGFGMAVWKAEKPGVGYDVWARTYNVSGIQEIEGPEGDLTCTDIIDNDCDGLTDIVDPDCTAAADAPHDTITDCTTCHDPGTYVPGATIPNSKCDVCHTPSGSLKAGYPTAQDVITHYSNNYNDPTTGQLVNIDCVECHNPMRSQSNLHHIRDIIRGIPVVFTATTGANSFADGGAPYDGICEVCHTQTAYHQNDGTAPGGQSHNNGTDCRSCHAHEDGFTGIIIECFGPHDSILDCAVCHEPGTYIPNPPIPDIMCEQCHTAGGSLKGSYPTAQDVLTHTGSTYGPFSINCVECHNDHCNSDNIKLIRSTIASSVIPGSQITFTAYTGPGSFSDGTPFDENICDTCHTQTNYHRSDGSSSTHNDGTDCTTCHTHINSYNP